MPFIKIHKMKSSKYDWPICKCVDRDFWEPKLYCNYYTHKGLILEWIFKCHLSKSTKWNLQSMTGLYLHVFTEIFESWSFIENITLKKVLFCINIQMPFIKIHKMKSSKYDWPLCRCVDRDLWESKLYCNYYAHKGLILEWIFKCHSSKSTKWNLQSMTGLFVNVLTEIFES